MKIDKEIPVPIYYQLKNLLKQYASEELAPGDRFYSERELARKHDIARATAGRVIEQLVNEGILYRIQGRGTFIARKENDFKIDRCIGLVMPFDYKENTLFAGVIKGAEEVASQNGCELIFSNSKDRFDLEREHIDRLKKFANGLIIFPCSFPESCESEKALLFQLKKEHFPFVLIDRYFEDISTPYVETDNFDGGYRATRYLFEAGHRKIGHVTGPNWKILTPLKERLSGYRKALADCGLPPGPVLTVTPAEDIQKQLRDFLTVNALTAVFASESRYASRTLDTARKCGLGANGNIAVIGFDEPLKNLSPVPMATIIQPMEEIGREAARVLTGMIRGEIKGIKKIRLKPELVMQDTTVTPVYQSARTEACSHK